MSKLINKLLIERLKLLCSNLRLKYIDYLLNTWISSGEFYFYDHLTRIHFDFLEFKLLWPKWKVRVGKITGSIMYQLIIIFMSNHEDDVKKYYFCNSKTPSKFMKFYLYYSDSKNQVRKKCLVCFVEMSNVTVL